MKQWHLELFNVRGRKTKVTESEKIVWKPSTAPDRQQCQSSHEGHDHYDAMIEILITSSTLCPS